MAGMNDLNSSMNELYQLPEASLRAISASLRGGQLSVALSVSALQPIAGNCAAAVLTALEGLLRQGMGLAQIPLLLDVLAGQRACLGEPGSLYDIVLSGPDVPGVPTADTGAVVQTLIADARESVMLVGYAVHNGKRLFAPLAERMKTSPKLQVIMCLDISRPNTDTSVSSAIVSRFAREFRTKHWPWPQLPTILYDPRALSDGRETRASLHAKCVIIDRRAALVTSANFTEAAYKRNIEAGVLVRDESAAARLAGYFEGLRAAGQLCECAVSGY